MADPDSSPKLCPVCGDAIKKNKCVHYGGLSCPSCRLFFRRIALKKSSEAKRCRNDGKQTRACIIDIETRNICAKCRYDKCIAAGMRPDLVQEGDAVAVKRREMSSPLETSSMEGSAITHANKRKLNISDASKSEAICRPVPLPGGIHEKTDGFAAACSLVLDSPLGRDVVKQLLAFHQGLTARTCPCKVSFHGLHVLRLLNSKAYQAWASKAPALANLNTSESARLIQKATSMHFTYVLTKYFAAGTGWDQVNWMVGESKEVSRLNDCERNTLGIFPFHSFFQHCKEMSDSQRVLKACFDIVRLTPQLGGKMSICDNKATLAACLLNYVKHSKSSVNSTSVIRQYEECTNNYWRGEIIGKLISVVLDLVEPIEKLFSTPGGNSSLCETQLNVSASLGLTAWADRHLKQFGANWRSLNFGEEILRVWLMAVSGTIEKRDFSPCMAFALQVNRERLRRIMSTHSEFTALDSKTQSIIIRQSAMKAISIGFLPLRMYRSCLDQVKVFGGLGDIKFLEEMLDQGEYSTYKAHPERLKIVSLPTSLQSVGSVSNDTIRRFLELQSQVSGFFVDERTLHLMISVLCFSPSPSYPGMMGSRFLPELLPVRNSYLRALEQRSAVPAEEILRVANAIEQLTNMLMRTYSW